MEKFGLSHPLPPVTQAPGGGESGEGTRQEPTEKFSLVSLALPLPGSPPPFHTHPALLLTTATVPAATAMEPAYPRAFPAQRAAGQPLELGLSPLPGSQGDRCP